MECWDDGPDGGAARAGDGAVRARAVPRADAGRLMGLLSALATPKFVLALGGWRASGFALCALLALSWGAWQSWQANAARRALALSEASVAVLEAQVSAANAIAADYEARIAKARADEVVAAKAKKAADAARARKWERIKGEAKEWAEVPVPDAVVEGLR